VPLTLLAVPVPVPEMPEARPQLRVGLVSLRPLARAGLEAQFPEQVVPVGLKPMPGLAVLVGLLIPLLVLVGLLLGPVREVLVGPLVCSAVSVV